MIYIYNINGKFIDTQPKVEGVEIPNSTPLQPPFEEFPKIAFEYFFDKENNAWEAIKRERTDIANRSVAKRKKRSLPRSSVSYPSWYPRYGEKIRVFGAYKAGQKKDVALANAPTPNAPEFCLAIGEDIRVEGINMMLSYVDSGNSYANTLWDYSGFNERRVVPQVSRGYDGVLKVNLNLRVLNESSEVRGWSAVGLLTRFIAPKIDSVMSGSSTFNIIMGGKFKMMVWDNTTLPNPTSTLDWDSKGVMTWLKQTLQTELCFLPYPYSNIALGGINIGGYNIQSWKNAIEEGIFRYNELYQGILISPIKENK